MAEPIASPCRQICQLGHDQVCVGCGRTIGEIAEWPQAAEARRRQIAQDAARRMGTNAMANKDKDKTSKVDSEHRPEQFAHRIELAVRWGDMDVMGHVNNAKFFTYDESSRIAYFDELARADPTFWSDHGLILAHIGCDFIGQLRYPATLTIGTRVSKLGRSSLHTLSAMFSEGRVVAVVKGVIVWFDYVNQKAMPIPEHVRTMIRKREVVAPEE
jgi:acyl-CoA thioester hydrolase